MSRSSSFRSKSVPVDAIRVDPASPIPLATQVTQQLVWLIASGRIRQSERLPSVRTLANHLGIAIQTVQAAYGQMRAAGLVQTRHGRGTVVLAANTRKLSAAVPSVATGTLGVLLPEHSPFYAPFLRGLQEGAKQAASLLFVCDTEEYSPATVAYLDQLVTKGVDGLIVTSFGQIESPPWRAALRSGSSLPPIVFADSPGMPGPGVLFDLERGAFEAALHIARHGHRHVGLVIPPRSWTNVEPIVEGHLRGLAEGGVEPNPELVAEGRDFSAESGQDSTSHLFDRHRPPTALLVAGETLVLGTLRCLKERGLRTPDDVALITFGNGELAGLLDPPLTTVALPARAMGYQAMTMLQSILAGRRPRPRQVVLGTDLVIRRSCGCGDPPAA